MDEFKVLESHEREFKIVKFRGAVHNRASANKSHRGEVTVLYCGETRVILLPVFSSTSSLAASAARRWRNVPGNLARIEDAFRYGWREVPSNR